MACVAKSILNKKFDIPISKNIPMLWLFSFEELLNQFWHFISSYVSFSSSLLSNSLGIAIAESILSNFSKKLKRIFHFANVITDEIFCADSKLPSSNKSSTSSFFKLFVILFPVIFFIIS